VAIVNNLIFGHSTAKQEIHFILAHNTGYLTHSVCTETIAMFTKLEEVGFFAIAADYIDRFALLIHIVSSEDVRRDLLATFIILANDIELEINVSSPFKRILTSQTLHTITLSLSHFSTRLFNSSAFTRASAFAQRIRSTVPISKK